MASRPIVLALVAILLVGALAGALPALPSAALTRVTLGGHPSAGIGLPFFVAGIVSVHAEDGTDAPVPMHAVAISVDGVDVAHATTNQQGTYYLTLPGIATAGHHDLVAHTDAGPVRTGESAPFDVLVYLAPLSPTGLVAGPGRHTGDVVLSWTAPAADEIRPVETFLILRREGAKISMAGQTPASQTHLSDNRAAGIPLEYSVMSVNAAGRSEATPWIWVTPALPPPADRMDVSAESVKACHASRCETLYAWDFIIAGGDTDPVDLSVHVTGRLTNHGAPVDLEPFNGTINDTYDDRISHAEIDPRPYGGKTNAQGGFDLTLGPLRVPNVRPDQACLRENLTVRAHYPGVVVPGGGGPDVLGGDSITIFIC
jgi:hypothetical protein